MYPITKTTYGCPCRGAGDEGARRCAGEGRAADGPRADWHHQPRLQHDRAAPLRRSLQGDPDRRQGAPQGGVQHPPRGVTGDHKGSEGAKL
eukprot:1194312-Prorocentrum_minimum.AAC.5